MFKSKYSTVLTIALIILIVAMLTIGIILAIRAYKNYSDNNEKDKVFAQLEQRNKSENEVEEDNSVEDLGDYNIPYSDTNQTQQDGSGGGQTTRRKAVMYKSYPVAGYIKISKTNVSYPILLDASPGALDTAVSVMYPSNAVLNQPGNVVIIGHNYRNGRFFSNNKNLVVGDKIDITDLTGRTLTYTIYETFQTTESDTSYITRDRGDNTEISLSTCTDDGLARIVVLARVQ